MVQGASREATGCSPRYEILHLVCKPEQMNRLQYSRDQDAILGQNHPVHVNITDFSLVKFNEGWTVHTGGLHDSQMK
jgi:hypothetical protein